MQNKIIANVLFIFKLKINLIFENNLKPQFTMRTDFSKKKNFYRTKISIIFGKKSCTIKHKSQQQKLVQNTLLAKQQQAIIFCCCNNNKKNIYIFWHCMLCNMSCVTCVCTILYVSVFLFAYLSVRLSVCLSALASSSK